MGLCMEHWTAGSYDVRACFMSCFGLKNLRHPYGLEDPETIAIDTACNLPYQTCLSFENVFIGVSFLKLVLSRLVMLLLITLQNVLFLTLLELSCEVLSYYEPTISNFIFPFQETLQVTWCLLKDSWQAREGGSFLNLNCYMRIVLEISKTLMVLQMIIYLLKCTYHKFGV
jgi:hypothetical protein